jgi:hypothetical protein
VEDRKEDLRATGEIAGINRRAPRFDRHTRHPRRASQVRHTLHEKLVWPEHKVIRVGHQQLVLRVERVSAPSHAAEISWHHQRAL